MFSLRLASNWISLKPTAHRSVRWSLDTLEPRLLLAGDVGSAADTASVSTQGQSSDASAVESVASVNLVFVDEQVMDVPQLLDSIDDRHELILLNSKQSGIEQISSVLNERSNVDGVHIIAHGDPGRITLGNEVVSEQTLSHRNKLVRGWSTALSDDADILLYGCHTGEGAVGRDFVQRLARMTGADVAASIDATGNARLGGDWDLEQVVGTIETSIALGHSERLQYQGLLPITITAAGTTNEEQMLLQIDGVTVATFDDIGGDAYGGVFETYTHAVDGVNADQVRIVFTNDLWDPDNGIDRNIRVDKITIDGTDFETEDPLVFSTGTWLPADGIQPGFRESEFLHADGYFQYAGDDGTGDDGSTILLRASGDEGTEQFDLQIDGQTVQTFSVGTDFEVYNYTANETVTADQIRVVFSGDVWDPANGIDANVNVDWIDVDTTRIETESPTVFSTGTWLPADGISPGFGRGQTLHTNGYFQYAESPPEPNDPEVWLLESAAFPGQYMRLDEVGGNVSLSTTVDARSMWLVTDETLGSMLQNIATGRYLDADGTADGGNVDVSSTIENDDFWTIVDNGATGLTLQNVDTAGYLDADSIAEGSNVDQSVTVAADDYWLRTIVTTPDSRRLPDATEITFAAFGDYGIENSQTPQISSLVHGLAPDIIVTLGDARYSNQTYAGVHGTYYSYYLNGVSPSEENPTGGTSSINRFFPAAGNHDYDDGGGISEYTDYFSLPGNDVPTSSDTESELYYDFTWGPAQFFVMDSEAFLSDSSSRTTQTAWLQSELLASTSAWQIVVLHIPPYSSGDDHGSNPALQLDYAQWGADLVLAGHDHTYERLDISGISYVVSGLGGRSIRGFDDIESGSVIRYNDDYGISYFTVNETQIAGSFVNLAGTVIDSFVIDA